MAAEIDFQPYLQSISTHYEQWEQFYTLTDAETQAKQKNEPQPWKTPFDFGLMVQTVQRHRSMVADVSGLESQLPKEKIERFPVLEGIRKSVAEHRQVLLVGRPGSGKSTTLTRLLLEESRGCPLGDRTATKQPTPSPSEEGIVDGTCIPVLVELRFWSGSILDRIQAFFQRHDLLLDRTQIEDLLFHRRLLLLMDGLNELPSDAARLDVSKFRQDYPKVSMIFTTRDLSLGGDFGLEKKLEMQPLTEAQIQAFVRSYVPEQAEAMLRQLKDRLREFGQTPLLLWMLCGLFRQSGQIPANLGEVFRAFTQGYEKNLKADVPVESDRRWWPELLQELAFWMMRGVPFGEEAPAVDVEFRVAISNAEVRQIFTAFLQNKEVQAEGAAQKYLDDLLRHHLIQRNGHQVEFRHQLLQEYYAAEYLLIRVDKIDIDLLQQKYLNYLKWTEPLILILMLFPLKDFGIKIVKSSLKVDLFLSAKFIRFSSLQSQKESLKYLLSEKIPRQLKIHLLGLTQSIFAIPHICKSLKSKDPSYRDMALGALYQIHDERVIPFVKHILLNDIDGDICGTAATVLGELARELHSSSAILALGEGIKHKNDYVRIRSIDALRGSHLKIAIQPLREAYKDQNWEARRRVMDALAEIPDESVIPAIVEALEDTHPKVRYSAIEALGFIGEGNIGGIAAISHLSHVLLNHDDPDIRSQAAFSLGLTGQKVALVSLRKALDDDNACVQHSASSALRRFREIPSEVRRLSARERIWWKINHYQNLSSSEPKVDKNFIYKESALLTDLYSKNFDRQKEAIKIIKELSDKKLNEEVLSVLGNLLDECFNIYDSSQIIEDIQIFQKRCKFYNYDLTQTTQSMKLFFSYAHKDEPLRDELAKHISLLKRQNIITDWHDRNITAGTDWAQAIDDNLNTANIILLLISSDFLASDYCYDKEMTRALEHHNQGTARVIPIILRPCDWHSAPFGKLQALPKDAKPVTKWEDQDEAFTHIAQGIRKAVAELGV
jgi:HEAT repeat protein/energy-coupling factor transporter ATP-binding protein EcfA2